MQSITHDPNFRLGAANAKLAVIHMTTTAMLEDTGSVDPNLVWNALAQIRAICEMP